MESTVDSILFSAFDERWKAYRSRHKTCRREFSEEAVHDLRVAARRLLAMLGVARELIPHPHVSKIRRAIKDLIEDLDELRDVQVMLADISENIEALPELKPFQKFLNKRETSLMRAAYKRIKQKGLAETSQRMRKIRESIEKDGPKGKLLRARLLEAADQAFSSAGQALGRVDASQPSTIHRLRLAFKKFRYLVEIVHPLKKEFPAAHFERMHDYQGMMGNIQDAEIFLSAFQEYVERHPQKTGSGNVASFYSQRLKVLINEFMENKGELFVFWESENLQSEETGNEPVHHTPRHRGGRGGPRIRRGQPAPAHGEGQGQDEKDRAGIVGDGSTIGPDPVQSGGADDGDGEHPGKPAGREEEQGDPD